MKELPNLEPFGKTFRGVFQRCIETTIEKSDVYYRDRLCHSVYTLED